MFVKKKGGNVTRKVEGEVFWGGLGKGKTRKGKTRKKEMGAKMLENFTVCWGELFREGSRPEEGSSKIRESYVKGSQSVK